MCEVEKMDERACVKDIVWLKADVRKIYYG
jgi:hypothetical protein